MHYFGDVKTACEIVAGEQLLQVNNFYWKTNRPSRAWEDQPRARLFVVVEKLKHNAKSKMKKTM